MATRYYLGKKPPDEKKILRKVLIVAGVIAIISTVVLLGYFYQYNQENEALLESFEKSLENQNYPEALAAYRKIQERKIASGSTDGNSSEEKLLNAMQNIVKKKAAVIQVKIQEERYVPDAADRVFLEQMGEVTGLILSEWLSELCLQFVQGEIERPTLQFVFDQVGGLANVSAAAAPLQKQIDEMEVVSGDLQAAEILFHEFAYIESVNKYQSIADTYENNSIISTFSMGRIAEIKKVMYQPLLDQCREYIDSFRYYSAENILSDMAQIFPNDQGVQTLLLEATSNTAHVVPYPYTDSRYPVEVVSVRPLIADKDLAFSDENAPYTNDSYLTVTEFSSVLQALYANNYILIDVRMLANMRSLTELKANSIGLPEGKKPVVVIVENINYSPRSYGLGFCRKLVLDDEGQVCGEYINGEGKTIVDREAEAIGILDAFVEEHPDFSFDGARGIASFSGFEVVMGYLTHEEQIEPYNQLAMDAGALPQLPTKDQLKDNENTVNEIMTVMRDNGWVMASSTYGYVNANSLNMEAIQKDTQLWLDHIGLMAGETNILVYPYGDYINGTDDRCVYLKDNGFRIFFGIDTKGSNLIFGTNNLYLDRAPLTGETLRLADFTRLFRDANIYDPDRPDA